MQSALHEPDIIQLVCHIVYIVMYDDRANSRHNSVSVRLEQ